MARLATVLLFLGAADGLLAPLAQPRLPAARPLLPAHQVRLQRALLAVIDALAKDAGPTLARGVCGTEAYNLGRHKTNAI